MYLMPGEERVVSRGATAWASRAILRCVLRLGGQLWVGVARSESGFEGIVLGLSRADGEGGLQAHLGPAPLIAFFPLFPWVLGLSPDQLLKTIDLARTH